MYNLSKALIDICKKYNIALLYIFGSQKENALKLINNEKVNVIDPLSDIDVGIVFLQDIEFINEKFMINKQLIIDRLVLIDGYLKELRILASLDTEIKKNIL